MLFNIFESVHPTTQDHLRYIDEIQCAAATVVDAVRQKAKENGDPDGIFDTFHIRRGDFQYKQTRIEATEIYENVKDVLVENSTVFIATDERQKDFFLPLKDHYKVYFLDDFLHLVPNLNKNYYGMLDQRIASRGRTFIGGKNQILLLVLEGIPFFTSFFVGAHRIGFCFLGPTIIDSILFHIHGVHQQNARVSFSERQSPRMG